MPTMSARYTVIEGEVIAQERSGVRHQLVPDPLGSTVALYNDAGTKTDTFQYWPYGESAARTGTTVAKFQYVGSCGYYTDGAGRNYVRARYLSSDRGRWVTEDPMWFIDGINLYTYVANSPTYLIDSGGYRKQDPNLKIDPKEWPKGNYTKYCGSTHQCPPEPKDGKPNSSPVDCLDTACAEHDRCLYRTEPYAYPWLPPNYGYGDKYKPKDAYAFCAKKLCQNVANCIASDACKRSPVGRPKCMALAYQLIAFSCSIFRSPNPITDIPNVPHSRYPK
jgi:RHS repeat-associated protein